MKIAHIVAVSDNGVIGKDNKLLWHLPNDMKYFKEKTIVHCVLMGRKTFYAIGKALPSRMNVVLTRKETEIYRAFPCASIAGALKLSTRVNKEEVFVIGGGQIYEATMDICDRVYMTEVHTEIEGDTFYKFNKDEWKEVSRDDRKKDDRHEFDYSFVVYDRK